MRLLHTAASTISFYCQRSQLIKLGLVAFAFATLGALVSLGGSVYASQLQSGNRTFIQQQKLTAFDGVMSDNFGFQVAIDNQTVVTGAPFDDQGSAADAGSAYVHTYNGTNWVSQGKLVASDAAATDQAGTSVAIDGDTAVVGAPYSNGALVDTGAVYVFVRTGSTWSQQAKLTAGDADMSDLFGSSVAVVGDTIMVGAPGDNTTLDNTGSAYIFTRSGTNWSLQAKLTAGDADLDDSFGCAVSIFGDLAIIGARGDDQVSTNAGAAYVFVRSGVTWSQQAKLTAADGENQDEFGNAVAIDGTTAVIGAYGDDDVILGLPNMGSAYVYTQFGTVWELQGKIVANDPALGDQFGTSVDISGNAILIGSPQDDDMGTSSGSAYLVRRNVNTWNIEQKIKSIDLAPSDFLGIGVGIDGTTLVVGAYLDDDMGINSGSAYVFEDNNKPTATPSPTLTDTFGPTPTPSHTQTPTATATNTATATPTETYTPSATSTPNDAELTATAAGATLTPTSTPTASNTPTITETPTDTVAPTATDTPNTPVTIELLANGSFETDTDANKIPDGWTQAGAVGDKRKCNVVGEPKIALVGECAYQFKGSVGENSRLNQTIDLAAINPIQLNTGDTIILSGFVWTKGGTSVNTRVKVRVTYTDSLLQKGKIDVKVTTTSTDYQAFTGTLNLVLAGDVANIKVQLINRGTSGKVRYDALSLQLDNDVAPIISNPSSAIIPLPAP